VRARCRWEGALGLRLRDRLAAIDLATVGFDVVCAGLAFVFEQHQKQTRSRVSAAHCLDYHSAADGVLQHPEPDLLPRAGSSTSPWRFMPSPSSAPSRAHSARS
jgi:hypothetical protein